jgi:ABC-type sugar transport system permease subunit
MNWGLVVAHIVIRATALVVLGFFIAFAAQRAEGRVKCLGTYLSYWLYLLAAASVVAGLIWHGAHGPRGGWHGPAAQEGAPAPAAPPASQ